MNKQGPNDIEWTHVFGPGTGHTWNVSAGCHHGCEWEINGSKAVCYAKTAAEEGPARAFYPQGFAHAYWHPKRLEEPLRHRKPAGIFLDSMSDLMGHWVSEAQVNQVLDICRRTPQHIYFLLTKNAPRLPRFSYPGNVWVGVSAPPSVMLGHTLTRDQQHRYWNRAIAALAQINASVRWLSIEPLTHDVSWLFNEGTPVNWAVLGAASNGGQWLQPDPYLLSSAIGALDDFEIPIYMKGNLRPSLKVAFNHWRTEFPAVVKQQAMF